MKKILTLSLAAVMLAAALVGCAGKPAAGGGDAAKTPEELTTAYKSAIEGARTQEENDAFSIITSADDDLSDLIFQMIGLTAEDMSAFAISISPMNTQAYGVAAIMPAEGKTDAVKAGLEGFIAMQKQNFDMYLMDQYDIAAAAKVETLEDGTVLLVMGPDQDTTLTAIKDALK